MNQQIRRIQQLSKKELELGILNEEDSWHYEYKDQAYIYIGGLDTRLTEADVLTIFSQYGNPTDLKLVHDKTTGQSKGFGYLKYEDQRSTILAVDNLNGAKVLNNFLKVDHVFYKPSDLEEDHMYQQMMQNELQRDLQLGDIDNESIHQQKLLQQNTNQSTDKDEKSDIQICNVEEKSEEEDEFADPMANFLKK
ncbi:related to U2 snRNP component IST3 [Saccharomycodes ludwigii]|uniref:Related to U2 snRNP component IST3 n=1 Tax=Saccharomycodes ludwigii TaxID=36035 RepID=A0A376B4N9_9ASCO|nr:related to U2 snRNP component IST3 [Saccharomycodes ludwigii]